MPDRFVEEAKQNMGAIERLLKGLPGIRGYVDKEMRRDADKRLRQLIAGQLEAQKQALFDVQQKLLKGGGIKYLDDVDGAIQKLQILVDRVKTASYGYAGLFDTVRIGETQLNALHKFDVALAARVVTVENAVAALSTAVANNEDVGVIIGHLTDIIADLNRLFDKRHQAIIAPDLLTDNDFVPDVGDDLTGLPDASAAP